LAKLITAIRNKLIERHAQKRIQQVQQVETQIKEFVKRVKTDLEKKPVLKNGDFTKIQKKHEDILNFKF
jgi:hypothetical protein